MRKKLFRCCVRRGPRSFDGTRKFQFVKERVVVKVFEENTKAGGGYIYGSRQRLADKENEEN